ncbi:MAG: hypothetical protein WBE26_03465, partial [Phycisphaerae bacterium]
VALRWSGWVLLAFVGVRVSTAEVYRAWRPTDATHMQRGMDGTILQATTAEEISVMLSNHLEPAVFRVSPAVARAYEEVHRAGLGPMRVSGAGSTLYRLFDEEEETSRAARQIEDLQIGMTTLVVAAPAGPGLMVSEEC